MKRKQIRQIEGQTTLPFRPLSLDETLVIADKHDVFTGTDSEFEDDGGECRTRSATPPRRSSRSTRKHSLPAVELSSGTEDSYDQESDSDEWQPSYERARLPAARIKDQRELG